MRRISFLAVAAALWTCGGPRDTSSAAAAEAQSEPRPFEPPVLTNAESPVRYPPNAYRDHVEGTVVLRLYLTSGGAIVAESTRVAESSGNRTLDSAALTAVTRMRFAPAQRNGSPVATSFLQPVQFQQPARTGTPPGDAP